MSESGRAFFSRGSWAFVALVFAIPRVYIVLVAILIAVDRDSAAVSVGFLTVGTWFVAVACYLARTLPNSVDVRLAGPGFAGFVASLAVVALAQFDVLDLASAVAYEVVVGAFAVAALIFALVSSR